MTKKFILPFLGLILALNVTAQDSSKPAATALPVSISGSVDVYYRFNGGKGSINNLTSFTNSSNSFELGMASLRADHSFGKATATVDLGFGRRAEEYSYNDPAHPSLFAIKQLYLSYNLTKKVKLTMGKWGTHIGYEVLDAFSNRNYSMDYMFSYGPFFHTGIKADISLTNKSALMIGVANPTDFSTTSSKTKVLLFQLSTGTKNDKLKAYLNYQGYFGVDSAYVLAPGYTLYKSMNQVDLVVTATLTSKISLGYNGTYQAVDYGKSANWWGSALYLNFDPKTSYGFTLRAEYFGDKKYGLKVPNFTGIGTNFGNDIFDATFSSNIKFGGLTIIPEIRVDNATSNIFTKSDGTGTSTTFSALLAAVYKF